MSEITSVAPTTASVPEGGSLDIEVVVADVPQDETATVNFLGSQGTPGVVTIELNRADFELLLGDGAAPAANQVRVTTDVGSLSVVSRDEDSAVVRFTDA